MKGPEEFEEPWSDEDQALLEELQKEIEDLFSSGRTEVELNSVEIGYRSSGAGEPIGEHVWARLERALRSSGWRPSRRGAVLRITK